MFTTEKKETQKPKGAHIKRGNVDDDPRFNCRFTLSRELAPLVLEIQDELGKVLTRKPSIPMTLRYMVHQILILRERTGCLSALMGIENLCNPVAHARARNHIPGFPTYV